MAKPVWESAPAGSQVSQSSIPRVSSRSWDSDYCHPGVGMCKEYSGREALNRPVMGKQVGEVEQAWATTPLTLLVLPVPGVVQGEPGGLYG